MHARSAEKGQSSQLQSGYHHDQHAPSDASHCAAFHDKPSLLASIWYTALLRPDLQGQAATDGSTQPCVQEVVKQHFDPDKFAGIFQKGGSGPPKWLDALASHR